MKLYNSLTRKVEEFEPGEPPFVSMYTCGITAYEHTTVGHMRTYINTDFLRRTLEYLGYKVKMVENVTDVGHLTSDADAGEDKLQKKAEAERKSAWEIAKEYEKEFFETMDKLNVLRPSVVTRATENIEEMIALVKDLEKKGYTYEIPGDGIYFDTSKYPEYGKLANLNQEELKAGARVEVVEGKKNPADFALWKFSPHDKKRDMEWKSPWAEKSFPGWHIECSAMSMKFLTPAFEGGKYSPQKFETIDLHTGGEDHLTVHHPNEIAQTEASTGKKFARFWFHNRFLMVEGQKMSKSIGNFYTMKDIEGRGFNPLAVRYLFATAHYRQRINFTWESLAAAQSALERLYSQVSSLIEKSNDKAETSAKWEAKFKSAIANDLNMPQAVAVLWEMLKSEIADNQKLSLVLAWDQVFGLNLKNPPQVPKTEIPEEVTELAKEREELRKKRKFEEADLVRKRLLNMGYLIEDTPKGYKIVKK
jgi:cysteinyl-tRNA synthetase